MLAWSGALGLLGLGLLSLSNPVLAADTAVAAPAAGGEKPAAAASTLTAADVARLFDDDFDVRLQAVKQIAAAGGPQAAKILNALNDEQLMLAGSVPVIDVQGKFLHALTSEPVKTDGVDVVAPTLNNRLRTELESLISVFKLLSPERDQRAAAVRALIEAPESASLALVNQARDAEQDPALKGALQTLWGLVAFTQAPAEDLATRIAALQALGESPADEARQALRGIIDTLQAQAADGSLDSTRGSASANDPKAQDNHATLLHEARMALKRLESRRARADWLNTTFSGLSLGSVLLLAALGLAITYGLIGVINMAHGEFLMLGAYATFVVQGVVQSLAPALQDYYLLAAIPVSFMVSAGFGLLIEALVLRHLYGRPLETLLATFGLSLLMMQGVRVLFGAQNVQVANPSWMSGAWSPLQDVLPGLMLPLNRMLILGFSLAILALTWVVLNKTRLGLFVRATTQNRRMAACVGVKTRRVDSYAFGFGTGIAGLGGCALSQIGNVGPDLGQAYIIDSFMVVVLGGVGQLAGTVAGAFGLGLLSKFTEPAIGAVLTKIAVLVLIILFIQKRPQGMFALKGRSAEA